MLGDNILATRKLNNMTQEELAEKVGVSRQTLSKWETGESSPDLDKARQLADALNVSLDELTTYENTDPNVPIAPKGKHAFGIVKVGDKGQIVIPAKARKIFDINPGDSLIVLGDEEQGLAMVPEKKFTEFMAKIKGKVE